MDPQEHFSDHVPKELPPAYPLSLPSEPPLNPEGLARLQESPGYSKFTKLHLNPDADGLVLICLL